MAAGRAFSSDVWPSTVLRRLAFMDSAIVTICGLLRRVSWWSRGVLVQK